MIGIGYSSKIFVTFGATIGFLGDLRLFFLEADICPASFTADGDTLTECVFFRESLGKLEGLREERCVYLDSSIVERLFE